MAYFQSRCAKTYTAVRGFLMLPAPHMGHIYCSTMPSSRGWHKRKENNLLRRICSPFRLIAYCRWSFASLAGKSASTLGPHELVVARIPEDFGAVARTRYRPVFCRKSRMRQRHKLPHPACLSAGVSVVGLLTGVAVCGAVTSSEGLDHLSKAGRAAGGNLAVVHLAANEDDVVEIVGDD